MFAILRLFKKIKSFLISPLPDASEANRRWLIKILDILPKPFFLLDFKANKVFFTNKAARHMMGFEYESNPASRTYLKSFSLFDVQGNLVLPENLPTARILRGEKTAGEEFLLVSKAGRFNIKVFSEDIPSMYGQEDSALIFLQDITTLKKTENDLRHVQTDLNEAVEIAQVGFWNVDLQTNKTSISHQLMNQFGVRPEEFDGKLDQIHANIHDEDRQRVTDAINKSIQEGLPYRIEYRVVRPDGDTRWIEAKGGTISDSNRFAGTTLDITEKMKVRRALEAKEKDLRLLADSMPQIVWRATPAGELDYFNQIWFDYCGANFEANEGSGWIQFVHADDLPLTIERWKKSLETNQAYENEFRLRHHSGEYRWHVARARTIYAEAPLSQRKVKNWYGTNTDIHDQKLLAEKLEESRLAAERANLAKSQFLANMSHEIRTPLGAIMGFSELIKENGLGRVEREEYISVIERNSSQLLRIIDDILDLSKVEAGMMLIENIEFSLPEALTDFSSLMGFKAREKGIRFSSKANTVLPSTIFSDPTRLRQILMNVVGNAIKFTDQGFVELRVGFKDDYLEFEVQDTGRGISPDQEKNLFQPFTQADASTTRKYGGTGLGLVLTRSLAEALGGEFILKQSELGLGSIFLVRIKATATASSKPYSGMGFESEPSRTMETHGQLAGLRLLLVEDSPDNQALISIYLNRAGAHVEIASDGEQGLKMAMSSSYDVILMDVQMPIMDGITAVKKLREKNYLKPIIALTAHAMKEERIRCLQAGFSDFLSKPVNREDLVNMILNFKRTGK
ncbi:MAG: PAS domain-containing protein [Bdellovibrionaceae bacterium]|nr:PAS domain-containing protein [Pseudobdellovibrionaceae bacterium]